MHFRVNVIQTLSMWYVDIRDDGAVCRPRNYGGIVYVYSCRSFVDSSSSLLLLYNNNLNDDVLFIFVGLEGLLVVTRWVEDTPI